jgi:hypothetical protein
VVGVVLVNLPVQCTEQFAKVVHLDAQSQALTEELAAIHAPPGDARLSITTTGTGFDPSIVARGPAEQHIAVAFIPARRHGSAVAILTVISLSLVRLQAQITLAATGSGI